MTQPSLFSADLMPPELADLGGLLAAHGQAATDANGSRLSILLADKWRAAALVAECVARGVSAETLDIAADSARASGYDAVLAGAEAARRGSPSAVLMRTEFTPALDGLVSDWTRGAVKRCPAKLDVTVGFLRVWLLAAGRPTPAGFTFGLDPHSRESFQDLAAAAARAGLAMAPVGVQSSAPLLRLTGRRRLTRLLEMVGDPPQGTPGAAWPVVDR